MPIATNVAITSFFLIMAVSLLRVLQETPPRVPRGKFAMGCKTHATRLRRPWAAKARRDFAIGKEIPDRPMQAVAR
jgi:hypothetical protein